MKRGVQVLVMIAGIVCVAVVYVFVDDYIAPLFLNSRIERLHETGLPKASVKDGYIYFRMKADDFRLPLPRGYRAMPPIIASGRFDTVDGSVEVHVDGSNQVSPIEYEASLQNSLQVGGSATIEQIPGGMLIKFHYFGDR